MSPSAMRSDALKRANNVEISARIKPNLYENAFSFLFYEFPSLSSCCRDGYADHP